VEDVEFQHLRHELRWFSGQLGDARNLDVYLKLDLDEERHARAIRKREKAYDHVADAMNSSRLRRLLIDLVGWAAIGAWRSAKAAQRPVESFANRRLDKLWRPIASRARGLASMDEITRHELRIQVKKMRYAIEFLHGLYPHAHAAEKRFASAVENLQKSLGKLNDMATAKTLSGGSDETWLISSQAEGRHATAAEDALCELVATGPFWRVHEEVEPA
jgi:CHAD domain-containing protein